MSDIFRSVKEIYDQIGLDFSASRVKMWPEILPHLETLNQKGSVLDLGCGNGRLLTSLTPTDYTGVDFSPVLIKEAQKLHPKNNFIVADITDSSFWQNQKTFDTIISLAVIHHLDEAKQLYVLQQCLAHLKPNGRLLLSVWNLWQPKYFWDHLRSWRLKFLNFSYLMVPFNHRLRPVYAFTPYSLHKLAEKVGFRGPKIIVTKGNLILSYQPNP